MTTTQNSSSQDMLGEELNSATYFEKTACGNIFLTFCYGEKDKIKYVLIEGESKDTCGKTWFQCVADMLTFSLRRLRQDYRGEVEQIIKNFQGHRCPQQYVGTTSCPNAIAKILRKVLDGKGEERNEVSK